MARLAVVLFLLLASSVPVRAEQGQILSFAGPTMGTSYVVKIFNPPEFEQDVRLEVDALLRRVNDQMSTYIRSSEISRFNASDSTEWFEVSSETAMVVDFALAVSAKTQGAFDVTVGPLVNAWSFGPEQRTNQVPSAELLDQLRQWVGYEKLSVRLDPPALRKQVPGLQVDLSAIAKGHGVDRVVALLNQLGAADVFVEIGGEVGTSGSKAGQSWMVGIQTPDASRDEYQIAHPLGTAAENDRSMATSGDYRIFFEAEGKRYSHTIDPRTGKPIDHPLASVSVVTDSCMAADAWATAINVLGPEAGLETAKREGLSVLLISRRDGQFLLAGTGVLAKYANRSDESAALPADASGNHPLAVLVITVIAFAVILSAMAVGVIFGRKSISGSCGGLANRQSEDGSVSCSLCSNPSDACKELRDRMKTGDHVPS